MTATFDVGDWFTFTEGPHAGLPAIVTDLWADGRGGIQVEYDLVGDGRDDTLKKNAVYEYCTPSTAQHMMTTQKLHRANREG